MYQYWIKFFANYAKFIQSTLYAQPEKYFWGLKYQNRRNGIIDILLKLANSLDRHKKMKEMSANFTHKQFQWIEFEDINAKVWILFYKIVCQTLFFNEGKFQQQRSFT